MNLRPSDLGPALHRELVLGRARTKGDGAPVAGIGAYWTRWSDVSRDVTDSAFPIARRSARKVVSLAVVVGAVAYAIDPRGIDLLPGAWFAASGATAFGGAGLALWPRRAARRAIDAPPTPKELEKMLRRRARARSGNTDPLEAFVDAFGTGGTGSAAKDLLAEALGQLLGTRPARPAPPQRTPEEAFLELARDASGDGAFRDPDSLRDAIAALGKALHAIPALDPPGVEAGDLVVEAQVLLRRAANESDPVVEASLMRQARALIDRSKAVEQADALAKRTRVLRGELLARIDSLRSLLPGLRETGAREGADTVLHTASEHVRTLEQEGRHLADARRELAEALQGLASNDLPATLRVGTGTHGT